MQILYAAESMEMYKRISPSFARIVKKPLSKTLKPEQCYGIQTQCTGSTHLLKVRVNKAFLDVKFCDMWGIGLVHTFSWAPLVAHRKSWNIQARIIQVFCSCSRFCAIQTKLPKYTITLLGCWEQKCISSLLGYLNKTRCGVSIQIWELIFIKVVGKR